MTGLRSARGAAPVLGVVLDLDGTLVDHEGAVTAALDGWLPTLGGGPVDPGQRDELHAAWVEMLARHFAPTRTAAIPMAEQRRRRLRDFLPLVGVQPGDDAALDAVFARYERGYRAAWRAFEDVVPALEALAGRGIRTAVLSNGVTAQQRAKLVTTGLSARVGPLLTAEGLGAAKPDPGTYAAACRALGLAPAQVVHVGDDHALDVVGARAAGLRAVHLDRSGRALDPDRVSRLDDLPGRWT